MDDHLCPLGSPGTAVGLPERASYILRRVPTSGGSLPIDHSDDLIQTIILAKVNDFKMTYCRGLVLVTGCVTIGYECSPQIRSRMVLRGTCNDVPGFQLRSTDR